MVTGQAEKVAAKARVLVVEDDASLLFGIKKNLQFEGYQVLCAPDGEEGLRLAVDERPDLVILDIMLPKMNGFEVCETLRKNRIRTPVIFLTAKAAESSKITGFDLGGDDYITKPFSVRELLARVKSILRRLKETDEEPYRFGRFVVDFSGQIVRDAERGGEVNLTTREYQLLRFLIHSRGKVLSRETILQQVWGFNYYGTARTIDNFVTRLRHKIEDDIDDPRYILTVRGVGYKFSG